MQLPKALYELEFNHGSIYGEEGADALLEVLKRLRLLRAVARSRRSKRPLPPIARHGLRSGRDLGHRRARAGHDRLRRRARRRGDHHALELDLDGQRHRRPRRGSCLPTSIRRTLNLDPAEVERKITPRTKAILPVHLYGQCADMDATGSRLARPRGIRIVEDCAMRRRAPTSGAKPVAGRHRRVQLSPAEEHGHAGRRAA